jgi:hypothetical protein
MKILSLGTYIFAPAWRELGHTVKVVTDFDLPPHPDTQRFDFFSAPRECEPFIGSLVKSFVPDIIFQGDHSTPLVHCGLEAVDVPKAWLAIDTHLHGAWHKHYASLFDIVFCAQQNTVPAMNEYRHNAQWLPLFCQGSSDFLPWTERSFEVSFVGKVDPATNPDRARLFDALRKKSIPLNAATGNYVPVYRSSKIVINQSVAGDLNLRFFEATGCGALLITDRLSHSMNDILEEGADFLTYTHNDADDLAAKINCALGHPLEAEAMARRAHAKITAGYLEPHTARRVIEKLQRLVAEPLPRREDPDGAIAHCAWAHDYCSRLKLPPSLTEFFADRGERLAEEGRASEEGRPWALLVLAGQAVDHSNFMRARSLLMQVTTLPHDPDFRVRYFSLKTEADALTGFRDEAVETLSTARREFPSRKEWTELKTALKL